MIRESLDADAVHAVAYISNGSAGFQTRSTSGGSSVTNGTAAVSLPCWLRLVRNGSTLAASASTDGNSWTSLGTTALTMSSTAYVGMAVSSLSTGAVATARFDNVDANAPPVLGNLVWRGGSTSNTWDIGTTANWYVGTDIEPFYDGNLVTFNDIGDNTLPILLAETLQPGAVAVNASVDYVFGGTGSLEGGMLLSKSGTGTLTLSGANGFTGSTTVSGGALRIDGSLTASPANITAGILEGGGTLAGTVAVGSGGSVSPGNGTADTGTLTLSGGTTLSNATLSIDLASSTTVGSGVNDLIDLDGGTLELAGTSTVELSFMDDFLASGSYTLIANGGGLSGGTANLSLDLPSDTRQTFGLSTSSSGITLDVTGDGATLVWDGSVSSAWDLNTTANWLNGAAAATFYNLDGVTFDDSSANGTVTISDTVEPLKMTVTNASLAYTISGGIIAGRTQLLKAGDGTLTLGGTNNTYSGGTLIDGGTVTMNSAGANTGALGTGTVTLQNGGTLAFYNTGSNLKDVGGNSNDLMIPEGETGNLQMPSRFGYTSDFDGRLLGSGTLNLQIDNYRCYYQGDWSQFSGQINISPRTTSVDNEFRIDNSYGYAGAAIYLEDGVKFDTIPDGLTVEIGELSGSSGALLAAGSSAGVNPTWSVGALDTDATFAGTISDAGTTALTKVGDGTWTLTGNNSYSGQTTVETGTLQIGDGGTTGTLGTGDTYLNAGTVYLIFDRAGSVSYAGDISGGGILTKRGTGTLTLSGSNTSIGRTTVEGGTMAVIGSGSMEHTPSIVISSGACFDVSGRTDGGMSICDSQRLSGTGTVIGDITMEAGSILSIGDTLGTLTFSNSVLQEADSSTVLKISKSPATNDLIRVASEIQFGGELLVSQSDSTALAAGDSFQLFEAPAYSGTFSAFTLPSLTAGLEWNTYTLGANGTIAVRTVPDAAPAAPADLSAVAAGTSRIDLSWSALSEANTYSVLRATSSGGSYSVIATGLVATAYADTSVSDGTTYYYVVNASNDIGTGDNSAEASATTEARPTVPPDAPASVAATVMGAGQIDLSWSAPDWTDSYSVKRAIVSGGSYETIASGLTETSWSDTTASAGTLYFYVISASNTYGESGDSAEVSATPTALPTVEISIENSTTATAANGSLEGYTLSSFNMNGGDALVVMITEETSTAITGITFDGSDMLCGISTNADDVASRPHGAHIYYLTDVSVSSGDIVVSGDSSASDDFVISALSFSGVGTLAGADAEASSASDGTVSLSYTTTTADGFVVGCGVNNWYQYGGTDYGAAPSVSGNPTNTLYSGYVDSGSAHLHACGSVPAAGAYTDVYSELYQGNAFATIAFHAAAPAPIVPAAPTNLTATAASGSRIDLEWTASSRRRQLYRKARIRKRWNLHHHCHGIG